MNWRNKFRLCYTRKFLGSYLCNPRGPMESCGDPRFYDVALLEYDNYHRHRNQSEAKQHDFRINYLQNYESESESNNSG